MWHLYGFALLAGIASAIEPGQNATLAKALGRPMRAGLICFAISVAVFAGASAFGAKLPTSQQIASAPWWAWGAGVMGAILCVAQLTVSKRIGAAPFLGLVVTAGVVTSIGLDHFGLVGFERHSAGRLRLLGGAMMIAGVTMVALL